MNIEFHDSLVLAVAFDGTDLILGMERVSIYGGDRLMRQERGTLQLRGVSDVLVDGQPAEPKRELDYGRVLDWSLEDGVGEFLLEWVAHAPPRQLVTRWTVRSTSQKWEAESVHSD